MTPDAPTVLHATPLAVYLSAEGGEPLVCAACGVRVGGTEAFTSDGVTTLHARPECDPDWKPAP